MDKYETEIQQLKQENVELKQKGYEMEELLSKQTQVLNINDIQYNKVKISLFLFFFGFIDINSFSLCLYLESQSMIEHDLWI